MLKRTKIVPRQSFGRIIKTVLIGLLILTFPSAMGIHKKIQSSATEFEHHLQRDFVHQLNQSLRLKGFKHLTQRWTNELIKVYENQLHQYRTAAVLPNFQNDRLQIHLNRSTLIKNLFGQMTSISSLNRNLCIKCILSDENRFHFTIRLQSKSSTFLDPHVEWTLNQFDSTVFNILSSTSDTMQIVIRQRFSNLRINGWIRQLSVIFHGL